MSDDGFYDDFDDCDGFDMIESIRPLCVTTNQIGTRVAVGHERGFILYSVVRPAGGDNAVAEQSDSSDVASPVPSGSTHPPSLTEEDEVPKASSSTKSSKVHLKEIFRYESLKETESGQGGVGLVSLLFDTHNFAVVGGGKKPLLPLNKLRLMSGANTMATISMPDAIRSVVLAPNKVLILSETQFMVTNFRGEKQMDAFLPALGGPLSAPPPPLALASIGSLCALPGASPGHVQLFDLDTYSVVGSFSAHSRPVSCIAMDAHGKVLATASQRGTLFRVWDIRNPGIATEGSSKPPTPSVEEEGSPAGSSSSAAPTTTGWAPEKVAEVRNATLATTVRHLRVINTEHILCLSGSGLKIFYVGKKEEYKAYHAVTKDPNKEAAKNQSSIFHTTLGYVSEYFNSEWPCSEATLPDEMWQGLDAVAKKNAADSAQRVGSSGSAGGGTTSSGAPSATTTSSAFGLGSFAGSLLGLGATSSTSTTNTSMGYSSSVVSDTSGPAVSHYEPVTLDDFVTCWWEKPAVRALETMGKKPSPRSTSSATTSPAREEGDPMCQFLLVATAEGSLMRYSFNSHTGVTKLVSMSHSTK